MTKFYKLLIACILFSSFEKSYSQTCTATAPTGLSVTNITSCSEQLNWKPVANTSSYSLKYKKVGGTWSNIINAINDTFYVFNNLMANTQYQFAVRSKCPDGTKSTFSKKKGTTISCTLPSIINVDVLSSSSVKINLTAPCSFDSIRIRYSYNGGAWIYFFTTDINNVVLTGLQASSTYTYEASTCKVADNIWTVDSYFTTLASAAKPNIIYFVLDDARWDTYGKNFGPSFFQSPNIDRIIDEGVNFRNHFAVNSFCTPARATMVTGLYPHKNGAVDNGTDPDINIPTVASILHDSGYYCGLLGKFYTVAPLPGYDYWLAMLPDYYTKYFTFTNKFHINQHCTTVLTDTAVWFINNAPRPFYLWIGYYATHDVKIPQPGYENLYSNEVMPNPGNVYPYPDDYPSNLDKIGDHRIIEDSLSRQYKLYFELMKGIDDGLGRIIDALEDQGILDSTMIVFTSDNGFAYGEHTLYSKRLSYEPCTRIPLFIRYPAWFTAGSVVSDEFSLNTDLLPTVLEAANIDATPYNLDGFSLKKLYDGSKSRDQFFYEYLRKNGTFDGYPTMLSVRSWNYQYIWTECTSTTEEFFDLTNDPQQNINLIFDPAYTSLIDQYRDKLDSFKVLYNYNFPADPYNCFLINNYRQQLTDDDETVNLPYVMPNPSTGNFTVVNPFSKECEMEIINTVGMIVYREKLSAEGVEVSVSDLPAGLYHIRIISDEGKKYETNIVLNQ
ncbi:MAG: sulfatase-like hydrolase/transferase [Chitinophagales bacterium]|nr:sulfatase-like hydrolase/transferase [Chitinophagales bacterium]